jgi:hypothetical protein
MKAKIDNVKEKIQDNEEKGPWSRPTLARRPVFGQVGCIRDPHDKSPPRTTSPLPTGVWAQTHGSSIITDACGGTNLHVMQMQQLAAMQAARPAKSLNVGLTSCAAITSPSSPTLPHASSARGTRAPSTTRTSLDLGSDVAS